MEELQTHSAFDQNQDGTVSEDEAKFFLHMDNEMEKESFLVSGWPLIKPYLSKIQGLFDGKKNEEEAEPAANSDQHAESVPEVYIISA